MERTNGIKRSETWNKIYDIVKTVPREKMTCDAPDAPSVAVSIEELFLKLLPIHGVINWVAVNDKMPESGQCVMIYSKNGGVAEGAYIGAKGHFEQWRWNAIQKDVTHWKPLCEPPCL